MQTAAITSRFLTGSSKAALADSDIGVSPSGLFQHIVASCLAKTAHSQEIFDKLTKDLIRFAEQAYLARDLNTLDEVSQLLMSLPVDPAQQIGIYYYALAIYRKGQRDEAEALLEKIVNDGPITYRARALQTLGANYLDKGQLDETLRFQLEALRMASDNKAQCLQTIVKAHFEIAVVRSLTGDHQGSLSNFEKLWPLVCHISNPFYFYLFQNGLAVELGEVGRVQEAKVASKIALTSPFAAAYPEWAETRQELAAKRTSATPSVVPVRQTAEGIPASRTEPQHSQKPDRVLAFCRLIIKGTAFQITLILIAGFKASADRPIRIDILDQLGRCFRARAPPPQH